MFYEEAARMPFVIRYPKKDVYKRQDGIYVLLKEVIDNSIDEFKMQAGKKIEITVEENLRVSVRDYGRGCLLYTSHDGLAQRNIYEYGRTGAQL